MSLRVFLILSFLSQQAWAMEGTSRIFNKGDQIEMLLTHSLIYFSISSLFSW